MTFIVFDLDDTLFTERDYVESAYREIARRLERETGIARSEALAIAAHAEAGGLNVFDALSAAVADGIHDDRWMVDVYRTHMPDIFPAPATVTALETLRRRGYGIGLLTEGRTLTQANKIEALGLRRFLTAEPSIVTPRVRGGRGKSFAAYTAAIKADRFVSVGDNPAKDFAEPNATAGWTTVAVRDHGRNIHPQHFDLVSPEARPRHIIDSLSELPDLLSALGL